MADPALASFSISLDPEAMEGIENSTFSVTSTSKPVNNWHSRSLANIIAFMNSDEAFSCADVTLLVGDESLKAHKIVLASHSTFLREALLTIDHLGCEAIISLPEADPEDVKAILKFMYSGKLLSAKNSNLSRGQSLLEVRPIAYETYSTFKSPEGKNIGEIEEEFDEDDITAEQIENPAAKLEISIVEVPEKKRKNESKDVEKAKLKKKVPNPISTLQQNLECCETKFEAEVQYAAHKESVHMEKLCDNRFLICCDEKILGTFDLHLKRSHQLDDAGKFAKCCDDVFDDVGELTKHCEDSHGLKISEFKGVNCCATKISNLEEFAEHRKESDNGEHFECIDCAFISTDDRHLNYHRYNRHGQGSEGEIKTALSCKHCQKTFKHIHLRQEHEDRHDDSYKYKCQICSRKFKLITSLKSHMYRLGKHHNPEAKEYNCDGCEKVFPTLVSKRKHNRVEHQKKKSLSCGDCSQDFMDKHRLDNHTKVVHLKIKDVLCNHCGKMFPTQERMRIHERFVHIVEEVACDICEKPFANRERMADHRRSVHKERKYQCEECGSTFKNSSTLKSHVVSIHLEHQKKPLQCRECGKGFLHESRLKAHEIIHTDDAPFKCQYCGRPNKCKNNNLKHEKRCKKGPNAPPTKATGGKSKPATTTSARKGGVKVTQEPGLIVPKMEEVDFEESDTKIIIQNADEVVPNIGGIFMDESSVQQVVLNDQIHFIAVQSTDAATAKSKDHESDR